MSKQRVTASQLFVLADEISRLAAEANQTLQQEVVERLNSALVDVIGAAKSAAFNEAHHAHVNREVFACGKCKDTGVTDPCPVDGGQFPCSCRTPA